MAETSSPDQRDTFDADFKDDFNQRMLRMLSEGSSNDVRIILSDGEIMANKDVLAAQSEYFAASFRFKEKAEEGPVHIDITDCSKEVMERIIEYLFTGSIKFKDLSFLQLMELLNQMRKMLLKGDLQDIIKSYIKVEMKNMVLAYYENLKKPNLPIYSKHMPTICIDFVRGLEYADRFVIDGDVKRSIVFYFLMMLPNIANDREAIFAFSTLPCHLVEDLCSEFKKEKMKIQQINNLRRTATLLSFNSAQLKCLLAWFNQNKDVCQEDKNKILATIDLDSLPAADLFELVKPSGLFPDDEVDKRIVECLRERDDLKKKLAAN